MTSEFKHITDIIRGFKKSTVLLICAFAETVIFSAVLGGIVVAGILSENSFLFLFCATFCAFSVGLVLFFWKRQLEDEAKTDFLNKENKKDKPKAKPQDKFNPFLR